MDGGDEGITRGDHEDEYRLWCDREFDERGVFIGDHRRQLAAAHSGRLASLSLQFGVCRVDLGPERLATRPRLTQATLCIGQRSGVAGPGSDALQSLRGLGSRGVQPALLRPFGRGHHAVHICPAMAQHIEQHATFGPFGEREGGIRLPRLHQQRHHLAVGIGLVFERALATLLETGGTVPQRFDPRDQSLERRPRLAIVPQAAPRTPGCQFRRPDPGVLPGLDAHLCCSRRGLEGLTILAPQLSHVGQPHEPVRQRATLAELVEHRDASLVLRQGAVQITLRLAKRPDLDLDVGQPGPIAGRLPELACPPVQGSAAAYSPRDVWTRARKSRIRAMPLEWPSCS